VLDLYLVGVLIGLGAGFHGSRNETLRVRVVVTLLCGLMSWFIVGGLLVSIDDNGECLLNGFKFTKK
jgi:hypothetical protein